MEAYLDRLRGRPDGCRFVVVGDGVEGLLCRRDCCRAFVVVVVGAGVGHYLLLGERFWRQPSRRRCRLFCCDVVSPFRRLRFLHVGNRHQPHAGNDDEKAKLRNEKSTSLLIGPNQQPS
jgi:hypothetical protein